MKIAAGGDDGGGMGGAEAQQMKFMVNNVKSEIDFLKKMFTVQKLQKIDAMETKNRNLGFEIEVIKMNMESVAKT